jgi:cytochrome b561
MAFFLEPVGTSRRREVNRQCSGEGRAAFNVYRSRTFRYFKRWRKQLGYSSASTAEDVQVAGKFKKPNTASVVFHWVSVWAMVLALHFGLQAVYGTGQYKAAFLAHAYAGLTVLGTVVVRLFLRVLFPWPKEEPEGSRLAGFAAQAAHWALYAMMLLTPLTGWIVASSKGCCVKVPGLPSIDLLALGTTYGLPLNAKAAYDVHVFVVWSLFALIGLHVAAALFHHFVRRDTILIRMLPNVTRFRSLKLADKQ